MEVLRTGIHEDDHTLRCAPLGHPYTALNDGNAIRRFLMLFWIEFKRCQGVFVALLLGVGVTLLLRNEAQSDGLVLWRDVSLNVGEAGTIIGGVGAAYAVWVVDRTRRRRMREQEAVFPAPQGRAALLSMLAVLGWMLVAYGIVFTALSVPAVRHATWGGPDVSIVLIGALTIGVSVGIGAVIGRFGHSPILAPLTLLLVFFGQYFAASQLGDDDIGLLIPARMLDVLNFGMLFELPMTLLWAMLAWLAALTLLLSLVALLLRERSVIRVVGGVCAVVLVIASAGQVVAEREDLREHATNQSAGFNVADDFELDCRQADVVEVCVHPAYSALLDEFVVAANRIYGPFAGLSGLPSTLLGGQVYRGSFERPGSVDVLFFDRESIGPGVAISFTRVFASQSSGTGDDPAPFLEYGMITASQCVVLQAMWQQAFFDPCVGGLVPENPAAKGPGFDGVDPVADEIAMKIASFSALSPEEQHAWLDSHWDELRAGKIAVEDMP